MAFKIGLQDVSYDPDLHTGVVDFDFFDATEPPSNSEPTKDNDAFSDGEVIRRCPQSGDAVTLSEDAYEAEVMGYKTEQTTGATEGNNFPEFNRDQSSDSEPEPHRGPDSDSETESNRDPGSDSGPESHRNPASDSDADSGADRQSHSGPGSPSSDRLQTVVRDVTAIQDSLHRLRLSVGTENAPRSRGDAPPPRRGAGTIAPPARCAESGRARRPRPRSGCPQRKRWSSSLAEAALTQRQIAQLLHAESDSSSSDMVGGSESDSDAVAPTDDVQTWLGAAGSTDRGSSGGGSARSARSAAGQPVSGAAGSGRSAPPGRLGLLADAVRHLERTKPRTAPPAPRRPVRAPHRKNMSFTNEEVRQIDRHNRILLNKIVAQQRRAPARPPPVPGGGLRRGMQDQISRDNMILLQKIRGARPSHSVISGFHDAPPPVRPILERGAVRHRRPWVDR